MQGNISVTVNSHPGKNEAEARILASAAGLFANYGYNGVSTRDIAAGAGVNEVTIYRHYPRKRDLYLAVLDAELQQIKLRGELLARIAEAQDGRAVLVRTFELIASTLMHKPELLRLVQYSTLELGEDIDPMLRKHLGQLVEVTASYLQPWVTRGALRSSNAKALIFTLIAIVLSHRPLHRVFAGPDTSLETLFESIAQFCAV
jgi:TetR/AcrR family transcriptional regulator